MAVYSIVQLPLRPSLVLHVKLPLPVTVCTPTGRPFAISTCAVAVSGSVAVTKTVFPLTRKPHAFGS